MKPLGLQISTLLLAVLCTPGCATGWLASPHDHLAMRPDLSTTSLERDWVQVPSEHMIEQGVEEELPIFRVTRDPSGELVVRDDRQGFAVRAIEFPNQPNRFLVEFQQIELDGEQFDGGSLLAVAAVDGDTLSLHALRGDKLAECMRQDGHSGIFEISWLTTTIDADTDELMQTIKQHSEELLVAPTTYKALQD